jgi:hypothetical protein
MISRAAIAIRFCMKKNSRAKGGSKPVFDRARKRKQI